MIASLVRIAQTCLLPTEGKTTIKPTLHENVCNTCTKAINNFGTIIAHMLYDKIRYADEIRKLYRIRHLLVQSKHPDIASRLGYKKYSKQFYRIKQKLIEEKVLDKQGRFLESLTNRWLVELPVYLTNKKQLKVMGNKAPYFIFLALAIDSVNNAGEISEKLKLSRRTVYDALEKLSKSNLIKFDNSSIHAAKDEHFYSWLSRYLELCKTQADTAEDVSLLFDCAPAYIDGPQAYYMINYEPGRAAGPADMIIRTYEPYKKFWQSVLGDVRYFKGYPKKVEIAQARAADKVVLLEGVPYNKKVKLELEV